MRLDNLVGRVRSPRLFALIDQGFQGVANIVAMALLGRQLPAAQFGAIGMMVGIYFFMAGFHRSGVVLPYITEHHAPGGAAADRRYHSDWWWLNLLVGLILAVAVLALAGIALLASRHRPDWAWVVEPLALSALILPPLLSADHVRRWLYKIDRAGLAAFTSFIYFVGMVAAAAIVPQLRPDAVGGAFAWLAAGVGGTVSALVLLRPAMPDWSASLACFNRQRRFAIWLILTSLPYVIYSSATVVILIGVLVGPLPAAIFTAARTLTNPATSIVSAIDSTDKPRAARALAEHGLAGLRQSIAGTRRLLVLLTGGYLAAVALFAAPLLSFAFHDRFGDVALDVRILSFAFFLFCLNQPSETMLIVLKASNTMFVIRMLTAVLTVAALIAAIPHGVSGMAIALVLSQAANLLMLYLAELHLARGTAGAILA